MGKKRKLVRSSAKTTQNLSGDEMFNNLTGFLPKSCFEKKVISWFLKLMMAALLMRLKWQSFWTKTLGVVFGPGYLAFGPRYSDFGPWYSKILDLGTWIPPECIWQHILVLFNWEGLGAKMGGGGGGQVKANHGFGTDPQRSDGTDDRIDHTATCWSQN